MTKRRNVCGLQTGDRLIDVDGNPIEDHDTAKGLILKTLKAKRFVTFIVERPVSRDAKSQVKAALVANRTLTGMPQKAAPRRDEPNKKSDDHGKKQ